MKPQFRPDVFFMPTSDGVSFSGLGPDGQAVHFALRGRSLYQLTVLLRDRLNGRQDLGELLKSLSPFQRPLATQLIQILSDRSFIRDASLDQAHTLNDQELELYTPQINYLDCYVSQARQRFEKFRRARIALVGRGWTAACLAQALWENGLQTLTWLPGPAHRIASDRAEMKRRLALRQEFDPTQHLVELPAAQLDWADYDLVLYAEDGFDQARLDDLSRQARQSQVAFYPAYYREGRGWCGPLQLPHQPGCWECAGLVGSAGLTQVVTEPFFGPVAAALLGNVLAYRIFRYFTMFVGPENRSIYSFILETLDQRDTRIEWQLACEHCQVIPLKMLV